MERVISKEKPLDMVYSSGCINSELSVNGINEIDMTDEQRRVVMERMMSYYMEHLESLNNLMVYFLETEYQDYDSFGPCECCGDYTTTFKITI